MASLPVRFIRSRSLVRSGMLLPLLAAASFAHAQEVADAGEAGDTALGEVIVVGKVKTDKTERAIPTPRR